MPSHYALLATRPLGNPDPFIADLEKSLRGLMIGFASLAHALCWWDDEDWQRRVNHGRGRGMMTLRR